MNVVLCGRVVDGPLAGESVDEAPYCTFTFGDVQIGLHRGQELTVPTLTCCEVIVRGPAVRRVLDQLESGSPVIVAGALTIKSDLDDDTGRVLLSVEATALGRDLVEA